MKTYFTLSIILMLSCNLQGQVYESLFGVDSTRWNITIVHSGLLQTVSYVTEGDTVLNGQDYTKIGTINQYAYRGYLRQNTTHSKAWFIGHSDTTEYLVMDLDLNVGDSMYFNIPYEEQFYKVDSVYYLNNRKHIQFDFPTEYLGYPYFTLIEGLVSNLGFTFVDEYAGVVAETNLLCAYKDGIQIFDIGEPCYMQSTSTNEISSKLNLKVFPNPVDDYMNIEFLEVQVKNYTMYLMDLTGKVLQSKIISSNDLTRVATNEMSAGFYYLLIYDDNNELVGREKIIIQ